MFSLISHLLINIARTRNSCCCCYIAYPQWHGVEFVHTCTKTPNTSYCPNQTFWIVVERMKLGSQGSSSTEEWTTLGAPFFVGSLLQTQTSIPPPNQNQKKYLKKIKK